MQRKNENITRYTVEHILKYIKYGKWPIIFLGETMTSMQMHAEGRKEGREEV
jgi:hypothetical protein